VEKVRKAGGWRLAAGACGGFGLAAGERGLTFAEVRG